ncbi:MAG: SMP-30/gluconolactonase/LRE family protein [Alphaproteobacteria bacterium]
MTTRSAPAVTCVLDCRVALAEGLAWHEAEQRLYWVDIPGPAIHRFDPVTGHDESCPLAGPVGCIAFRRRPDERGGLVAALASGFAFVDFASRRVTAIGDPEADKPANRFNDGRAGPDGAFWAGTMAFDPNGGQPAGALWRLAPDLSWRRMRAPVRIANGLAWSNDGRTLYHADTGGDDATVQAWDFDAASGAMTGQRLFAHVPRLFADRRPAGAADPAARDSAAAAAPAPDGACVDSQGGYWLAIAGGWAVARFRPDGAVDRVIDVPVQFPTMPGFGGHDMQTLFIASLGPGAGLHLAPDQPQAGSLFACRPGFQGIAEHRFAG